jgi:hypothetical protein
VLAQIVGGAAAILTLKALYPDVSPAEAANAVIPQIEGGGPDRGGVATTGPSAGLR